MTRTVFRSNRQCRGIRQKALSNIDGNTSEGFWRRLRRKMDVGFGMKHKLHRQLQISYFQRVYIVTESLKNKYIDYYNENMIDKYIDMQRQMFDEGPIVEKNDEDQKIEQDGIKPEDKAHKAATKIQASFRGHITRKKLKGEKKGDAPAAEAEANEKDEAAVAEGTEKKEGEGSTPAEAAPGAGPKPEEKTGKAGETPSEEKKGEGAPDAATEQAAPQAPAPSEEKAGSADTESATKASTDNSPSSKAEDAPAKEEPKQADPPTETAESSQAEEKIEAVDETKPKDSARQDEGKGEEREADQEHA
ncbi:hypothetical protein E5288_WYG009522 [Bos mutus]|uniref:Neuromodulin n=1 Tax=Bos mutus TaxID=72004 RepID=A0A6B0RTI5_9CETA|nr:hypothetical protein [Bos mutus]